VPEELARHRVGDDGALIADDRIGEPGFLQVREHRAEHAAGDDDDVDPRVDGASQGRARARPQQRVLADQRPVEIARERLDVPREVPRDV
jgi:hypothetical protein